jgi:hypothetical protein
MYAVSDSMPLAMEYDLRRGSELVTELTTFFPTFAPKIFGFFNFRPENFPVFKISSRKILAGKTFVAKKSGRTNFQAGNFWPENISNRASGT